MKKNIMILAAASMILGCSCTNNVEELASSQNEGIMEMSTTIVNEAASRAGFASKTAFVNNDAMGLFMYKGAWGTAYPSSKTVKQNNKSTFAGTGWNIETPYYLGADKGTVWAYFPYDAAVTDGKKIPVTNDNTKDYMYGSSKAEVSATSTQAYIEMHHAMSQFVIRMNASADYQNARKLTSVVLKSKTSAKTFFKSGTMDVTTGTITGTKDLTQLEWTPNSNFSAGAQSDYCTTVFPRVAADGALAVELTLDGVKYTFDVPAIEWKKGFRYIYSFTMKGNSLVIGGKDNTGKDYVTIEAWQDSKQPDVTLKPM